MAILLRLLQLSCFNALLVTGVPCTMFDIIKGPEWRLPISCTSFTALSYPFGSPLGRYLASVLHKGVHLKEVYLSGCEIRSQGTSAVCKALENHTSITALYLGSNKIDAMGAYAIAALLSRNAHIQHIDMGYNALDNSGAQALAVAMTHTSLRSLILEGNHIGDDGVTALAAQLKGHFYFSTGLLNLRLGSNRITSIGAAALASGLATNPPLIMLDLGFNTIGTKGALDIFTALQHNSQLISLDVEHNSIVDTDELRSLFAGRYALTTLVLRSNALSGELVSLLLIAMPALESLDIGKTALQEADLLRFLPMLQSHSSLQRIYLDGLALTQPSIEMLAELVIATSIDVICDYNNMLQEFVNSKREAVERELKMIVNSDNDWLRNEL